MKDKLRVLTIDNAPSAALLAAMSVLGIGPVSAMLAPTREAEQRLRPQDVERMTQADRKREKRRQRNLMLIGAK